MSRMAEQQLYINGGYTSATSGRTFETINLPLARCWRPFRLPDARMSTAPLKARSVGKKSGRR